MNTIHEHVRVQTRNQIKKNDDVWTFKALTRGLRTVKWIDRQHGTSPITNQHLQQ